MALPTRETCLFLLCIFVTVHSAPVMDREGDDDEHRDTSLEREKRESFDMLNYLSKFGYLPPSPNDMSYRAFDSPEIVTHALKEFQRFNGLEVTGVADDATMTLMKRPRCGVPDKMAEDSFNRNASFDEVNPVGFRTLGSRWLTDTVTWKPTKFSEQLSEGQQWSALQQALDLWSEWIPIKFRYSPIKPDIEIKFVKRDHGDGWNNRFDGRGSTLAHAFGPGRGLGGDTHFDDDEKWTIGDPNGSDLRVVAAHEFGHALGLSHSGVPGALMAPYYQFMEEVKLGDDDIAGIQSIYGSKRRKTPSPATTTTTTTTTTPAPTTGKPEKPWYCEESFRLDAISKGPDGYLYVYRDDDIFKIGSEGLELGYPKYIDNVFPGAPRNNLRAVTYVPETRKTYMFKDNRVWRFTDFSLDNGYPRVWTHGHRYRPSAVLTLTFMGRSQIFMFGHDYFWEWNQHTEDMSPGYPLPLATYFPHAPLLPDAAYMTDKQHFIFFKYNQMKDMAHRGLDPNPKPLGPLLFGSVCDPSADVPSYLQPRGAFLDESMFTSEGSQDKELDFSPEIWTLINKRNAEYLNPFYRTRLEPAPPAPPAPEGRYWDWFRSRHNRRRWNREN